MTVLTPRAPWALLRDMEGASQGLSSVHRCAAQESVLRPLALKKRELD